MTNADKHIAAERSVRLALAAAKSLGATKESQAELQSAEQTLSEVRHYATTAASPGGFLSPEAASRLLSYVLGIQVEVTAIKAGYNDLERYARENC